MGALVRHTPYSLSSSLTRGRTGCTPPPVQPGTGYSPIPFTSRGVLSVPTASRAPPLSPPGKPNTTSGKFNTATGARNYMLSCPSSLTSQSPCTGGLEQSLKLELASTDRIRISIWDMSKSIFGVEAHHRIQHVLRRVFRPPVAIQNPVQEGTT